MALARRSPTEKTAGGCNRIQIWSHEAPNQSQKHVLGRSGCQPRGHLGRPFLEGHVWRRVPNLQEGCLRQPAREAATSIVWTDSPSDRCQNPSCQRHVWGIKRIRGDRRHSHSRIQKFPTQSAIAYLNKINHKKKHESDANPANATNIKNAKQ